MTRECAAEDCVVVFELARHPNGGWTRKRFCSARCQGRQKRRSPEYQERERQRNRGRQSYINAHGRKTREERTDWAQWWERQRQTEERRELRRKTKAWPQCKLHEKPRVRVFIGQACFSCGERFAYYARRAQSPYCASCNEAHHRRSANRRAKQNGALYEVIVPARVFERDGHRCQLCNRATRGTFPDPRSPTVDHIVPLAAGGAHLYTNVQCACFECNWQKADGAANDQLLLVG